MSNLHKISHFICVITSGSCLEKSSDFKNCFGLDIEATVEPGHRVKFDKFNVVCKSAEHFKRISGKTIDSL